MSDATSELQLGLAEIRTDGNTQPRAELSEDLVKEYGDAMTAGDEFPAAVVFHDGSTYWLADGFHRFHAARRAELPSLRCAVTPGTRRDAVLYSVGANNSHGLRRTNEDKRRAVLTLLEDDEWSQWSDREIARRCRVNNTTVSKYRGRLTVENQQLDRTYTTKHGAEATMKTENIGSNHGEKKRRVLAALEEMKGATNQEIAEATGAVEKYVSRIRGTSSVTSPKMLEVQRSDLSKLSTFVSGNLVGAKRAIDLLTEERGGYPTRLSSALALAESRDIQHWITVLGDLIGAARNLQRAIKEASS